MMRSLFMSSGTARKMGTGTWEMETRESTLHIVLHIISTVSLTKLVVTKGFAAPSTLSLVVQTASHQNANNPSTTANSSTGAIKETDLWMQTFCNFGEWMGGISHPMLVLQENILNAHLQYVAKDVGFAGNAHAQDISPTRVRGMASLLQMVMCVGILGALVAGLPVVSE